MEYFENRASLIRTVCARSGPTIRTSNVCMFVIGTNQESSLEYCTIISDIELVKSCNNEDNEEDYILVERNRMD